MFSSIFLPSSHITFQIFQPRLSTLLMWGGGKKIEETNKKVLPLVVPLRRPSRSLGTNFETKIFEFRWFLGSSDQNELYHTPLLSKI